MSVQAPSSLNRIMWGSSLPVLVFLAWEATSRAGLISPASFSKPSSIGQAWLTAIGDGSLVEQTLQTLTSAMFALAIAVVIGIGFGVLIGLSRAVAGTTSLTIEILRPIPSVALIPLSLLIFGFGYQMSATVAAFASVWPILIMTSASIRTTEPTLKEIGVLLQLSYAQRLFKVVLPAVAPGVMVGVRLAVAISIVVVITTEIVANPMGLGYGIIIAQQSLQTDLVWATLIWIGCVGWFINYVVLAAEKYWLSWYWESRT